MKFAFDSSGKFLIKFGLFPHKSIKNLSLNIANAKVRPANAVNIKIVKRKSHKKVGKLIVWLGNGNSAVPS